MKMMKKPTAKKMVVKKAQTGKKQKPTPTYKNLNMGVRNEQYLMSGQYKDVKPTSSDSSRYLGGYMEGLKGSKGGPNEGQVEKMGRWEGQNANKPKKKGKVGMKIKKAQPGIVKSMGSSAANTAASSSSSSSTPMMKGVTSKEQSNILSKVPAAGAARASKQKERSADGNYAKISKTRETPAGTRTVEKTRRTVQGILRGAPRVANYKKGGSVKSKKK